ADTFDAAWQQCFQSLQQVLNTERIRASWLRVDWVEQTTAMNWRQLRRLLSATKRNYFRFGLSLDGLYHHAFLEQELNANAMLYGGNDIAHAVVNEKNFSLYAGRRFPGLRGIDFSDNGEVFVLHTGGLFCGE